MNTASFPPPLPPPDRAPSPLDVERPVASSGASTMRFDLGPSGSWPRRLLQPLASARTWKETLYQLLNLPFGIGAFVVLVVLFSVGLGLAVTVVGLPVLLLTIVFGRVVGIVERQRARLLLDLETRPYPLPDLSGNLWKKFKTVISDLPGWGGIGYGFTLFPWGIFTFVSTVVCWSVAIAGVTSPTYAWWEDIEINGHRLSGAEHGLFVIAAFSAGCVMLVVTPWIVRGFANVDRWLVRNMLSMSREMELETRVEELSMSRAASVDSAASELRRIERDLHDGAQQRLVALAMDLGLARERLASGGDPQRAVELVDRAHQEAKHAISELRDLVRGIHPSVLTDRGLDAALSALAARSPVPVDVQVELGERPPPPIEAAAYFVVAEALTNVAKHSGASAAWVRVTERPAVADVVRRIVVEVRDDGAGGAELRAGGGLAGLRDRVAAVEGRLRIASPEGGPTMLVAELPCAS